MGGTRSAISKRLGVNEGWLLPGLSLLSCKLFEGVSDEELELMETGLTVSCQFEYELPLLHSVAGRFTACITVSSFAPKCRASCGGTRPAASKRLV
jgi:hypothetical protein